MTASITRPMPELPEVERVRRELTDRLVGRRLTRLMLHRRDVVRGEVTGAALLCGDRVISITRRGKQLAILGDSGRALCIHLGMSGQLFHLAPHHAPPRFDHIHVTWSIQSREGDAAGRIIFRDPRRFGGLWTFSSMQALEESRWSALGPDALTVTPRQLRANLGSSARVIKAALLDQSACAGVGNIYADEALFNARLHPRVPCCELTADQWCRLVTSLRRVLVRAIDAGGSTIRDYVGGNGAPGTFQRLRQVYGRADLPCLRCGATLESGQLAQRTTVWCPVCQGGVQRKNHKPSTSRIARCT